MSAPQIGFQGAKEPLDGQRLEVYPGINVSEIQESALFIRVPEERVSVCAPLLLLLSCPVYLILFCWIIHVLQLSTGKREFL